MHQIRSAVFYLYSYVKALVKHSTLTDASAEWPYFVAVAKSVSDLYATTTKAESVETCYTAFMQTLQTIKRVPDCALETEKRSCS